jgi:hypothetical protein
MAWSAYQNSIEFMIGLNLAFINRPSSTSKHLGDCIIVSNWQLKKRRTNICSPLLHGNLVGLSDAALPDITLPFD